ncbi:trimeric intracellular cation channel family protein [Mogibacterium sp. CM50]|uniref:trimeric intracellular cation channel family protein n=1 Tax=Mogibacterium sp. CM50 TaxID=936375 RepID=UPI00027C6307|nr:TRIC cation channel family protein [Mogibacterium sp. CM50]EJU19633.1 putative membrane protein [Mogibacterium sp. CM50]
MLQLYSIENIIFALEIVGTITFAISGATLGLEKGMDLMGITILGLTTSVGGGIIRDLIVGQTPPLTFRNPIYLIVSIITSVIVFLPPVRKWIFSKSTLYEMLMLVMDSVGLGVFTVSGIQAGYATTSIHGVILLSFVGVVTGVGGGVLRDMMAGDRPYIFVKHFYASASLIGAIFCTVLWNNIDQRIAMTGGAAIILVLRLMAARYRWSLPKANPDRNTSDS